MSFEKRPNSSICISQAIVRRGSIIQEHREETNKFFKMLVDQLFSFTIHPISLERNLKNILTGSKNKYRRVWETQVLDESNLSYLNNDFSSIFEKLNSVIKPKFDKVKIFQ